MSVSEWLEFMRVLFTVGIIVVPLAIIVLVVELIRLVVWIVKHRKDEEEKDEQ
jgi:uncharacterized membrane protein